MELQYGETEDNNIKKESKHTIYEKCGSGKMLRNFQVAQQPRKTTDCTYTQEARVNRGRRDGRCYERIKQLIGDNTWCENRGNHWLQEDKDSINTGVCTGHYKALVRFQQKVRSGELERTQVRGKHQAVRQEKPLTSSKPTCVICGLVLDDGF